MCEIEKEAISGEMCLEEDAYRSALVVAINLYNISHTKGQTVTAGAGFLKYDVIEAYCYICCRYWAN